MNMMHISKKYIVDGQGNPREVIIPYKEFQEIEELLGLDLDERAMNDLRKARADRAGNKDEYSDLDSV